MRLSIFKMTALKKSIIKTLHNTILISLVSIFMVSVSARYSLGKGDIRFDHLSIEDGLSHSRVNTLLQGKQNFMWFGTMTGLNKYDGSEFTVYSHNPKDQNSLSDNFVWFLYEDPTGVLWVCSWGGGLIRFDPASETFTRYRHDENNPKSLSNDNVWSVCRDSKNVLWVATENGLNKLDPATETFVRYMHDPTNPNSLGFNSLSVLKAGANGVLWIGTYGGGLDKFEPATETFVHYQHNKNDPNSLSNNHIWWVYEDSSGFLLIGTEGGLNKFDPATETFVHYQHDKNDPQSLSHNTVVCIFKDSNETLWMGTYGGGLNKFDPESGSFTRYQHDPKNIQSISNNIIFWIFEDNAKTLWFGTENGINKVDPGSHRFEHYQHNEKDPNSLSDNEVQAMYEDKDGVLWVGTKGGGLNKFNRKSNKVIKYKHDPDNPGSLSNNAVTAILPDGKGLLWIGTQGGGLNKFDPASETFVHYQHDPNNPGSLINDAIMDIEMDRDGVIWINTFGSGVDTFDPESETFVHYQDNENIGAWGSTVYVDPKGFVWLGFEGTGLTLFDPTSKSFTSYRSSHGLSNDAVYGIYADSTGMIWIGTNYGLNKFNPSTKIFTKYYNTDGLAGNRALGILEDNQGCLWISTDKGLSKFNPKTDSFRNYDVGDGLQSNLFLLHAAFRNDKGELFFGGKRGFNAFFPDNLTDNPILPPVVLTDFQLFNKSVPIGGDSPLQEHINVVDKMALSYKQSVFSFKFSALNYRSPEKNQYAYMMEGFDKDWTYVGSNRRFATYTNLDPRTYIFRVKASNNDGIWNEDGTSLKITITPPFWQTWWFVTLAGAMFLFMGFTAYRMRTERIRQKNLALEEHNNDLNKQIRVRKQAEEMLRESEEKYRSLIEHIPGAAYRCRCDERWTMEFISDEIEKITLYPASDFIDHAVRSFLSIIHTEDQQRAVDVVTKSVENKESFAIEYRLLTADGNIRWVFERGQCVVNEHGKATALDGVIHDITAHKQTEEEKSMLQSQIRQTQKIESLGTLAGGIAHEFNNVLGIIIGNTELAISDVPHQARVHDNLEEIQIASLRARDVVKQLLAFSRKTMEGFKPLNLSPLVKESLRLIRSSIPSTINISQNISAESDTVNADPTQINQVIINLCTNASHAMQEGDGTLGVSLDNIELGENDLLNYHNLSAGNYVRLTVTDTGSGMTQNTMENIFDPFFTTKEVGQGTGMGLSVVHGIVKDHGGEISVQSEPGKGSTFQVLFPIVDWILESDPKPTEPTPRGTEKILFVDDEKSIVLAAKHNLEELNYIVVTETDPMHALEVFRKDPQKFDLLITDTTMPGMTGDKLAKEVMKIRSDIPVILCTGYSERISEGKAQGMGIKAFVMKPVVTHEMAKTIRQILDQVKEEKTPAKAKSVLVVDDEEQMRSMIRQMLESAGFKVSEAPDGKVALWINKEKPADLIITDIIMPEKEGLDTIKELKRDFPDVKIIAISGAGEEKLKEYLDMAKKMGADHTLAKPFAKKELLKAVKDLLG